jgi:predicted hotdog family 3-hydroxylacyl-ACP dehydratase
MSATDADLDARTLVPHTSTARLLARVHRCTATEIDASGCIPAAHPLTAHGVAPAFLAIELGAQAAAAMETIGRAHGDDHPAGPAVGSLVRVRQARLSPTPVPVDAPLRVVARLQGSAPPLAIYDVTVTLGDRVVAEATLATYAATNGGTP